MDMKKYLFLKLGNLLFIKYKMIKQNKIIIDSDITIFISPNTLTKYPNIKITIIVVTY